MVESIGQVIEQVIMYWRKAQQEKYTDSKVINGEDPKKPPAKEIIDPSADAFIGVFDQDAGDQEPGDTEKKVNTIPGQV